MAKNTKVAYRRRLNAQQIKTLHFIYGYRFCTSRQIARYLRRPTHKAIQNKLQVLEAQGFLAKRYDKSYKLAGRPAEYYITPRGARELEKIQSGMVNDRASKLLYKNSTVSQQFLTHCIVVTDVAQTIGRAYSDKFSVKLFTKTYIAVLDGYPAWGPDLDMQLSYLDGTQSQSYFIDVWDGTKPFFVCVRKAINYVNFVEDGEWRGDTSRLVVLAVCHDDRLQRKLTRYLKRLLFEEDCDDIVFATTTLGTLLETTRSEEAIWTMVTQDDIIERRTLEDIAIGLDE